MNFYKTDVAKAANAATVAVLQELSLGWQTFTDDVHNDRLLQRI